jgi:methionyl-tRNA formyltransferase
MIDKSICPIDWHKSAFEIHNKIRGLQTWPCATAVINGDVVKIQKSELCDEEGAGAGAVIRSKNELIVSCGDNKCIKILKFSRRVKRKWILNLPCRE